MYLVSAGQLAEAINVPLWRIDYVCKRHGIVPAARVGLTRCFTESQCERIAELSRRIDDRKQERVAELNRVAPAPFAFETRLFARR